MSGRCMIFKKFHAWRNARACLKFSSWIVKEDGQEPYSQALKERKKEKKNKVLDCMKFEYYKKILDFSNIEYYIIFLITQILG